MQQCAGVLRDIHTVRLVGHYSDHFYLFGICQRVPCIDTVPSGSRSGRNFFDAIAVVWQEGYPEVSVVTFAAGMILPIIHLSLLFWVLFPLSFGRLPLFLSRRSKLSTF